MTFSFSGRWADAHSTSYRLAWPAVPDDDCVATVPRFTTQKAAGKQYRVALSHDPVLEVPLKGRRMAPDAKLETWVRVRVRVRVLKGRRMAPNAKLET
jgi:hypothetical protein